MEGSALTRQRQSGWWKALATDPERARRALAYIGGLFRVERAAATAPPAERLPTRRAESKAIVDSFFTWCEAEASRVLDESPSATAIGYALNQRVALQRFSDDGRLPIHNNGSERALRREAVGRKNWLFVGSADTARSTQIWGKWSIEYTGVAFGSPDERLAAFVPDTRPSFAEGGPEKPAPGQNLEWSGARHVMPSMIEPFDFDGDGTAEAIVIVETTLFSESGLSSTMRRGRVWRSRGADITLYPPSLDIAFEQARDVDGDGRPDLIGRGPFAGFVPNVCGSEELYLVTGPPLLFHATPDGAFNADDGAARDFARRECRSPPHPVVVVSTHDDPEKVDMAGSARGIACARLWGFAETPLLAEIGSRCRTPPEAGCPRCDDRGLLERWSRLPPPTHPFGGSRPLIAFG